jgi:membrane-bound serine protease (ClpP class)
MRNFFWGILITLLFSSVCYAAQPVYILDITQAIGPATQDYISQGLSTANQQHAALVIIQLNTPGGLEKSARKITQDIMASPVPVVTYVTPAGARATGAGIWILYASNIAAMTPGTELGGTSAIYSIKNKLFLNTFQKKIIENAIGNIRHLADQQNRNADWAEKILRNGDTLTSEEALKENVINLIANDIPALLQKLNGTTVNVNRIPIVLGTQQSTIETIQPNWRYVALSIITNPIMAYALLLIGIFGVLFTFLHSSKLLPGIMGVICLIITFYAFRLLPMNYIGVTLVLMGIACIVREIVIANFGLTGTLGILSFIAGSVLMLDMHSPGYYLPHFITFIISLASAGLFYLILLFTVKKIRKPKKIKHSLLVGKTGEVLEFHADHVMIRIQNEIFSAQSKSRLEVGQKVRVTYISNLILTVEPIVAALEK